MPSKRDRRKPPKSTPGLRTRPDPGLAPSRPSTSLALNQGNIVGHDLGPTAVFAVFSMNTRWQSRKGLLIAAGLDNLFDKTYAEHLSRSGSAVGFVQTTRVN